MSRPALSRLGFERLATDDVRARIRERAAVLAAGATHDTRDVVDLLLRHLDLWLIHQRDTEAHLEALVDGTTPAALQQVARAVEDDYAAAVARAQRARFLVTFVVLSVIGALTAAGTRRRLAIPSAA